MGLTSAFMCSAKSDGCVVNLNNQASVIMERHGIPTINLHDAIVGECGPSPQPSCFNYSGCFCPHCSQGDGVGYEFLAKRVIVPALAALISNYTTTARPSPSPTPLPIPSCHDYGIVPNYSCNQNYCVGSNSSSRCCKTIGEQQIDPSTGCRFVNATRESLAQCANLAAK